LPSLINLYIFTGDRNTKNKKNKKMKKG